MSDVLRISARHTKLPIAHMQRNQYLFRATIIVGKWASGDIYIYVHVIQFSFYFENGDALAAAIMLSFWVNKM